MVKNHIIGWSIVNIFSRWHVSIKMSVKHDRVLVHYRNCTPCFLLTELDGYHATTTNYDTVTT